MDEEDDEPEDTFTISIELDVTVPRSLGAAYAKEDFVEQVTQLLVKTDDWEEISAWLNVKKINKCDDCGSVLHERDGHHCKGEWK